MKLKTHFLEIFRFYPISAPWPQMFLCALATSVPLFIGELNAQVAISIYGALVGYLVSLNDHLGDLKHRILVASLTFLLMIGGVSLGIALRDHSFLNQIVIAVMVYWLGLLGNEGAELERAFLFSVIVMVIVIQSTILTVAVISPIFTYSLIAYLCILIGAPILAAVKKIPPAPYLSIRNSFRKSLTWKREKHIHAFSYTLIVMLSLFLANFLHLERGYWIMITVLLVMKPDHKISIYVTTQRLLGTFAAVILCDLIGNSSPLVPSILVCTFLIPLALKRSYLLASFLVTIFILFLLELATPNYSGTQLAFVRLQATFIGCIFSFLGTMMSKVLISHIFPD